MLQPRVVCVTTDYVCAGTRVPARPREPLYVCLPREARRWCMCHGSHRKPHQPRWDARNMCVNATDKPRRVALSVITFCNVTFALFCSGLAAVCETPSPFSGLFEGQTRVSVNESVTNPGELKTLETIERISQLQKLTFELRY